MKQDIDKAIEVLNKGGIILYPTHSGWSVGCDATNFSATQKIYELKQLSDAESFTVLIDNIAKLESYVDGTPEVAYDLFELSDKPLTIIFDKGKNLASNVVTNDGCVGISLATEPFSKQLCQRFRKPIVSTSANRIGQISPSLFSEISKEIKDGVDYIAEYGQSNTDKAKPSGIIKLGTSGQIKIIRQ